MANKLRQGKIPLKKKHDKSKKIANRSCSCKKQNKSSSISMSNIANNVKKMYNSQYNGDNCNNCGNQ